MGYQRQHAALGLAVGGLMLSGCIPRPTRYTPNPPSATAPSVIVPVAVLPVENAATDPASDPTNYGIPAMFTYGWSWTNLAKPQGQRPAAMPPEFWRASLAEELRHSGLFASVQTEPAGAVILIEGKLNRASWLSRVAMLTLLPVYISNRLEASLSLRALRASDRQVLWEKTVQRQVSGAIGQGRLMAVTRSMLNESALELAQALEARRADGSLAPAAVSDGSAAATSPSAEDILKKVVTP